MPNRGTHKLVGTIFGGGFALARSESQPAAHRALEKAGCVFDGIGLEMLPDIIEPEAHPAHPSVANRATPAVKLGVLAARHLDSWHTFLELRLMLLTGVVAGALCGYGSRLALNAYAPRNRPLIA